MMKKLSVVLLVSVLSLILVTPVLAYNGVDGRAIDSLTLNPWTHGGDVWIVNNTTGAIVATCRLNTAVASLALGEIEDGSGGPCDYGDNALSYGGTIGLVPGPGDHVEVIINYTCEFSNTCTGGPNGDPGDSSVIFTEAGIPIYKQLGYIKTGTGPNAITLANVTAASAHLWLPVGLAALALVAFGAVVVVRKRR